MGRLLHPRLLRCTFRHALGDLRPDGSKVILDAVSPKLELEAVISARAHAEGHGCCTSGRASENGGRSSGLAGLLSEESLFCRQYCSRSLLSKSLEHEYSSDLIRPAHFFRGQPSKTAGSIRHRQPDFTINNEIA